MNRAIFFVSILAACGRLPHVPPEPRSPAQQRAAVVRIETGCAEPDMTSPEWNSDVPGSQEVAPWIQWAPPGWATGTVISDQDVITAAHAVRCPIIPDVMVIVPRGERFPSEVVRDDGMFGDGTDLARVEVIGAYDRLGIDVAPPALSPGAGPGEMLCAQPFGRDEVCGEAVGERTFAAPTFPGDSGSPVYDPDGLLVGIVVAGNGTVTRWVRIGPSWLSGT